MMRVSPHMRYLPLQLFNRCARHQTLPIYRMQLGSPAVVVLLKLGNHQQECLASSAARPRGLECFLLANAHTVSDAADALPELRLLLLVCAFVAHVVLLPIVHSTLR